MIVDTASQTQLGNIEKRTGQPLATFFAALQAQGELKHRAAVAFLKEKYGLGHGDANLLVHVHKQQVAVAQNPAAAAPAADPMDEIYAGKKAHLRPIHEALAAKLATLGEFEIAPKKTYLSYRRKKQFAMIGPATLARVELGLNVKGLPEHPRLEALPPGQMCQYRVSLTEVAQVDEQVVAWLQAAYTAAG